MIQLVPNSIHLEAVESEEPNHETIDPEALDQESHSTITVNQDLDTERNEEEMMHDNPKVYKS